MTKFNSLLDQIKAPQVRVALTILQTAKSKYIQVKLKQMSETKAVLVILFSFVAMESTGRKNY